jgi:penicillin-binding protein 1A
MQTMQALLMDVTERGTAIALRTRYGFRGELAGKTGTTQNQADGWFMGMTPGMIVGVWVGGDSPVVRFRNLSTGQGGRTALPVFAAFLQKMQRDPRTAEYTNGSFNIPGEVYANLACEDYRESRGGIFDFLKREPEQRQRQERQVRRAAQKKDEPKTKVGKFLRKVFGKKGGKNK